MIDDRWLPISQALVAWLLLQPDVIDLGLKAIEIDPAMEPHPAYPANPISYCDRLVLRNYTNDLTYFPSRTSTSVYKASLFYYRLEVVGQNHQVKLLEGTRAISRTLMAAVTPTPLQQAGAQCVRVTQGVLRDRLRHPRLDEPRLRVSVSELFLSADAQSR